MIKKRVIVLSLGGSLIIPEEIQVGYLKKFKEVVLKNTKNYKFVIVCGGGSIARKYISALREIGTNEELQSFVGISTTRTNARFMSYFFGINQRYGIAHTMRKLKQYIKKQDIVFCGALEYKPDQTSDSTSAQVAKKLKTSFINLTNVAGLYDKNPLENKDAKRISKISWNDFDILVNKLKFKPGQHFVLDQKASKIIKENKIITYILGEDVRELDNLLKNKKFKGTTIGDF